MSTQIAENYLLISIKKSLAEKGISNKKASRNRQVISKQLTAFPFLLDDHKRNDVD